MTCSIASDKDFRPQERDCKKGLGLLDRHHDDVELEPFGKKRVKKKKKKSQFHVPFCVSQLSRNILRCPWMNEFKSLFKRKLKNIWQYLR